MKVLLIYPKFPDTFWGFNHALKFIRKKAAYPPLGLLTVAAMLPEEWPKRLVDINVTRLTEKDLSWADCAFISGMVVQRESVRQIITLCKEAGLKVVAGGPLFTSEYEQFEEVDHFVLNEASINLADDEPLVEMMVEAGFDAVFIGIETPGEKSLTECNKIQHKNRDLIESVKRIQRSGLQVQGGFIVGFDSDTRSIFQRQIDFIQKSGIVTAMVELLQAPPGTRLYERLKNAILEDLFMGAFSPPRLFPLVITLAIYGHHFRKICNLHIL